MHWVQHQSDRISALAPSFNRLQPSRSNYSKLYLTAQHKSLGNTHTVTTSRVRRPSVSRLNQAAFGYSTTGILHHRFASSYIVWRSRSDGQIWRPNWSAARRLRKSISLTAADERAYSPAAKAAIEQKGTRFDSFWARLFATRRMPTRQAIALLQSLGVKTLGFNSYRELVSRGETSSQILEFHADLKLADITVQESVYCKIVLKYAKEGNDDLLLSFIASDQHIETLESKSIQMQLLIHYSKTNNPTGIEHTMAVLAALNSTHVDNGIWKKLLLRILDDEPLSRHLEISQELISARIVVPTGVCSRMAKLFRASPYYPEKRFTHFSHLKHILMFLSESADSVGPNSWPDVLQAMRFVPDDLEDLLIELATLYGHMIASQNLAIDHRVNREFQLIFGPSGVKFIIGLGLDVRSIRKATTCPHVMLYGIDLLLRFRQRGLTIHNQGIIRSLNLVRAHRERQLRRHCKYLGANVERFFAANHRQILRLSMGRVFRRVYRRQRSVRQKNMFLPRSRKRHNQKPRER